MDWNTDILNVNDNPNIPQGKDLIKRQLMDLENNLITYKLMLKDDNRIRDKKSIQEIMDAIADTKNKIKQKKIELTSIK